MVTTKPLLSRPAGRSHAWSAVSSATTHGHGYVAFTGRPSSSTGYELFAGGPAYDGCQGGVVTVTVS